MGSRCGGDLADGGWVGANRLPRDRRQGSRQPPQVGARIVQGWRFHLEIVGADIAAALAIGAGLLVAGPVMTVVGTLMSDRARKRADERPLPTGIVYTTVALAGALTYGLTIGVAQLTGTLG